MTAQIKLAVEAAIYANEANGLVALTFNDGTHTSIYLNDGSPRLLAHDLLDAWLEDGNTIGSAPTE